MNSCLIKEEVLTDIANAIREKKNTNQKYRPINMAGALEFDKEVFSKLTQGIYEGDLLIPEGVTSLGAILASNEGITSLTLPESLRYFPSLAGCNKLTELTIPKGIKYIDYGAQLPQDGHFKTVRFLGMPYQIGQRTMVPDQGWDFCTTSIEKLYIPSVEEWCRTEFQGPTANPFQITQTIYFDGKQLGDTLTIPGKTGWVGSHSFSRCKKIKRVVVEEGVYSIDSSAFYECSNLEEVILPDSLEYIDQYAFQRCSSLTSIVIPNKIKQLKYATFAGCTQLRTVYLPESLEAITSDCFSGSGVEKLYFRSKTPPSGGGNLKLTNCTYYVPAESLELYRSAWPSLSVDILPIPEE